MQQRLGYTYSLENILWCVVAIRVLSRSLDAADSASSCFHMFILFFFFFFFENIFCLTNFVTIYQAFLYFTKNSSLIFLDKKFECIVDFVRPS